MPFNTGSAYSPYGTDLVTFTPTSRYCQNDATKSDYGKCYDTGFGNKARFVQTDTSTYPQLPCEADGTCVRYTSLTNIRILETTFNYPGKQAIVYRMIIRGHTSLAGVMAPSPTKLVGVPVYHSITDFEYTFVSGVHTYEAITYPYYDPVFNYKIYLNPYRIPVGNVVMIRWLGNVLTSVLYFGVKEDNTNNIWYVSNGLVNWFYESSPITIIPLNYEREYAPYQELRSVFGYSINGVDQPGWNANDIINALRELFPNRAWAVFDDRTYTLYLYNLTPDYVPDWLIDKLSPVSMKVLQPPSDSSIAKAWMDELNRRNAYNSPPPELP